MISAMLPSWRCGAASPNNFTAAASLTLCISALSPASMTAIVRISSKASARYTASLAVTAAPNASVVSASQEAFFAFSSRMAAHKACNSGTARTPSATSQALQ